MFPIVEAVRVSPADGEQDCVLIPTQSNGENQFISSPTDFSSTISPNKREIGESPTQFSLHEGNVLI